MSQPDITVLIATRDRVALLTKALEAIWAQEYAGHVRVVAVFDADIPADLSLPEPGDDSRSLTVVRNTGTPGLAGARNFGLSQVETDWVALCDDDDLWLPGKLAAQIAEAASHPDASCIGGGIRVRTGDEVVDRPAPRTRVDFDDLLRDRVMELHPSTFLMPTAVVREIGAWDEELPGGYAEDYDLLLRLAKAGPIFMVTPIVAEILWAGQSYYFSRWQMIATALEHMLEKFPEFARQPQGRARITGQIAFARAAANEGREARVWARRTLRDNPREPRAWLAGLVSTKVVSADFVQRQLHARGRGI